MTDGSELVADLNKERRRLERARQVWETQGKKVKTRAHEFNMPMSIRRREEEKRSEIVSSLLLSSYLFDPL